MGTLLFIKVHLPPFGETSGEGAPNTGDQQAKRMEMRQQFLDLVSPYAKSLPKRSPRRAGNVHRVKLLDHREESQSYLLLIEFDLGEGGFDQELKALLPVGSRVSSVGHYQLLEEWPRR